jgi:hypothetical protein
MKKYISGLAAIICALAFSAFTKPNAMLTYKLLSPPNAMGVVRDPNQWSTGGAYYGTCAVVSTDLACEINLNSTQTSYYHTVGADQVLNNFADANGASPKQDHLVITEGPGVGARRIITSITPKHWDATAGGGTGAYVTVSHGADLAWKNGNF